MGPQTSDSGQWERERFGPRGCVHRRGLLRETSGLRRVPIRPCLNKTWFTAARTIAATWVIQQETREKVMPRWQASGEQGEQLFSGKGPWMGPHPARHHMRDGQAGERGVPERR